MDPSVATGAGPRADEAPTRRLRGFAGARSTGLSVALSLYALYWVLFIVQPQIYRVSFLLIALVLTFLLFPARRGALSGVAGIDWILAGAAVIALAWPILDFNAFIYRATDPTRTDLLLGSTAILLVLEAARRSVGWILPVTAAGFLVYAWAGPAF